MGQAKCVHHKSQQKRHNSLNLARIKKCQKKRCHYFSIVRGPSFLIIFYWGKFSKLAHFILRFWNLWRGGVVCISCTVENKQLIMFTQSLQCCSAWPKTIFGSIKPKGITDKVESLPIKTNYKTKYSHNMRCRLCDQQEESESHLLSCDEILDEQLVADVSKISLSDVWSTHNSKKWQSKL